MIARGAALFALAASIMGAGCTTVHITATPRSSVEQRLIVRSLERAVARLEPAPLAGRTVRLEVFGLTDDRAFAEEFAKAQLEARGIRIARGSDAPEVILRMFLAALAVDTAQTLLGLPTMQVPVLPVPIPELALFKWERSSGHAKVHVFRYDAAGRLLEPAEARLFRVVSVFRGGWTIDAAEAVAASLGALGIDVLDGLSSLADKSLTEVLRRYASKLAPGSRVAITHFASDVPDPEARANMERFRTECDVTPNPLYLRDRATLTDWLDGLGDQWRVLDPGVAQLPDWRPDLITEAEDKAEAEKMRPYAWFGISEKSA